MKSDLKYDKKATKSQHRIKFMLIFKLNMNWQTFN